MTRERKRKIRATFLAGLLTIVPVFITIAVIGWLFNTLTGFVPSIVEALFGNFPKIRDLINQFQYFLQFAILIIYIFAIYGTGIVARHVLGRRFIKILEVPFRKLPIFSTLYTTIRQITDTVFSDNASMFKEVIMVPYPHDEAYVIAFLTREAHGETQEITDEKLYSVFIPTTPNPTSGFLVFYPEHKIKRLKMSVSDAMRLIISAGVVIPEDESDAKEASTIEPQSTLPK